MLAAFQIQVQVSRVIIDRIDDRGSKCTSRRTDLGAVRSIKLHIAPYGSLMMIRNPFFHTSVRDTKVSMRF